MALLVDANRQAADAPIDNPPTIRSAAAGQRACRRGHRGRRAVSLAGSRCPQLAGDALFANGSPAIVFLMVTLWAPLFETLAAQVLPIALLRRCTPSQPLWISTSALLFSLGHVLGGGGRVQAVLTFLLGAAFADGYVRWLPRGGWRAFGAAALAHAVNNGVLFSVSTVWS